ncbi:MAG: 3-phosphoserine/phosphohydroxythreonine transaminase [Betaproteobacteria bacterium]|nr:3-phosphoserine/phosphohydroxythreonine transaminase [Betaproteobacteria bacterium]
MTTRPFNFAAGPSTLPEAVLSRAAHEMLDWHGSGMSVMEMTHRGTVYLGLFEKVMADFRRLLRLPDHYKILLMQGGATAQNALIPMNLMGANRKLDYVNTGHWSTKSINEARSYGDVHVAASSQDLPAAGAVPSPFFPFTFIPQYSEWRVRADSSYLHICGNETIGGVEFWDWPDMQALGAPDVPLIVDMSSHILSRDIDLTRFAMAYGGMQKNLGIAGVTFVILDEALIRERVKAPIAGCPSVFDYRKVLENDSMFNTPPTYAIYMTGLMLEWIDGQGGVAVLEKHNAEKAQLLYAALDASAFYQTRVVPAARSRMNVPFYLPDDRLYEPFLKGAQARGLINLKGHKAVGGLRASIYNAMPVQGVHALIDWLAEFEKEQA